jgi:hypothetical protein
VTDERLFGDAAARRVVRGTLLCLALVQLGLLAYVGNGITRFADHYSEADAIRSAQGFAEHGLTWNYGLPNILYGERFAERGWKGDRRAAPLPAGGVYTRYPPLANWIAALLEYAFGYERLWVWRLFPIAVGLSALAALFATLSRTFGADRGAVVAVAIALLPMTSTHMHGLHYHGYAYALLLLQIALAVRTFWSSEGLTARRGALFFVLGFVQGWLSFDLAFIVTLLALPLWLLRRVEARWLSPRRLIAAVFLPGAGFVLAHVLHFLQVVAFYGSLEGALADFRTRAEYRFTGSSGSFVSVLVKALRSDATYSTSFLSRHFGPMLDIAIVLVLVLVLARHITIDVGRRPGVLASWSGDRVRAYLLALGAALVASAAWTVAMPAMTVNHPHIIPRHFFLTYLSCALVIVLSVRRAPAGVRGPTPDGGAAHEGRLVAGAGPVVA